VQWRWIYSDQIYLKVSPVGAGIFHGKAMRRFAHACLRVPGMFMPLEGESPSANLMEVASRIDLEG
jgi:hypothetical protein